MATIRPFAGIHYAHRPDLELSKLIAPPYDVLDDAAKTALQARHPNNIVTVDLPHTPPKSVGPDQAYQKANTALQAWLSAGILVRDRRPALYPYTQTFDQNGRTYHRRGFICTVGLEPLGEGHIVPHEKTYAGAIEDRLKLMHATAAQLSPVFGLFSDPRTQVTKLLYQNLGKPMLDGTIDGVRSQLWAVTDNDIENQVIQAMGTKSIFIADGHHRYTTALQYQADAAKAAGGKLPPPHPANFCMFVLVAMQDDGLLIQPTHRLIGGLENFDVRKFTAAVAANFSVVELVPPPPLNELAKAINAEVKHTFGLYDAATRKSFKLVLKNPDVLAGLEPGKSQAWRRLDVAILQRYLLEEILQPHFATSRELSKGYTANAAEISSLVDGTTYQLALLLRPTPLSALEDLGKHREVMPQKSTYFWPKLATGMLINPLK